MRTTYVALLHYSCECLCAVSFFSCFPPKHPQGDEELAMDVAYDQVQDKTLPDDTPSEQPPQRERAKSNGLNAEVREAIQAFQGSSWGASLGGWWGAVKKQVSPSS